MSNNGIHRITNVSFERQTVILKIRRAYSVKYRKKTKNVYMKNALNYVRILNFTKQTFITKKKKKFVNFFDTRFPLLLYA